MNSQERNELHIKINKQLCGTHCDTCMAKIGKDIGKPRSCKQCRIKKSNPANADKARARQKQKNYIARKKRNDNTK